ncbi:hypothetical protein J6590_068227 [Homalodisca vitripennis]|nr:hypothetical protein J6590_068227 [Homalodisca vitripennis]
MAEEANVDHGPLMSEYALWCMTSRVGGGELCGEVTELLHWRERDDARTVLKTQCLVFWNSMGRKERHRRNLLLHMFINITLLLGCKVVCPSVQDHLSAVWSFRAIMLSSLAPGLQKPRTPRGGTYSFFPAIQLYSKYGCRLQQSLTVCEITSSCPADLKVLGTVCENTTTPFVVRSPFQGTIIKARKRGGYGRENTPVSLASFTLTYKTDQCGGIVHGPQAIITSPGYPNKYPPNLDCAWVVEFQQDTNIHVKFEAVDLDPDCSKDFLRLYNGENQGNPHLIPSLCGNTVPGELKTQSNFMFLEFHSGPTNTSHKGFRIILTQDSTGCGGILHSAEGILQSPNYGKGDYPNNTECEWTVILPPGYHASLSFIDRFFLEVSEDCANDFIQETFGFKRLCPKNKYTAKSELGNLGDMVRKLKITVRHDNESLHFIKKVKASPLSMTAKSLSLQESASDCVGQYKELCICSR